MPNITAKHGKNSLVYINGSQLTGANSWSLEIQHEFAEYAGFGDTWKSILSGLQSWSGGFEAYSDHDAQILQTAVLYDGTLPILIYDDQSDGSTYYSGSAGFSSFGAEGAMDAVQTQSAEFTGDGALAVNGFSA